MIVRRERPRPGAQLSIFDEAEGLRRTAFMCDTAEMAIDELELRHWGTRFGGRPGENVEGLRDEEPSL
ncbi:MAG: hypothetical protein ACP5O0_02115 [Acidimicrobiales bacterium]